MSTIQLRELQVKFGGSGRTKQACKMRRYLNMAVMAMEEGEEDLDAEQQVLGMHGVAKLQHFAVKN